MLTESIIEYYQTEASHCLVTSMVSGIVLLALAVLFLFFANPASALKGAAVVFLLCGLIFGAGGFFAGIRAKKTLPQKIEYHQSNPDKFLEDEYQKVETIHKNWTGVRIFWSAALLLGVVLLAAVSKSFWTGVAIGSLIAGVLGHTEEYISYRHNEKYREIIAKAYQAQQSAVPDAQPTAPADTASLSSAIQPMKRHKTKHTRRAAENAQPLVMPDTMLPQRVQALPHRTSALPQAAPRAIYAQYAAGGTHYEPPQICKLHYAYLNMRQKYRHWRAGR